MEITSRERILKSIRQALADKTVQRFPSVDWDSDLYVKRDESKEEQFADAFKQLGGRFIFCENELEFAENIVTLAQENKWKQFYCKEQALKEIFERVDFPYTEDPNGFPEGMVGITTCEALISRLGSVLVSSRQGSGRRLFVIPTVHIILAYSSQIVSEMKDGLQLIKNKYGDSLPSMIASITGPSRTADIEKTLVTPAHGPRDIFVFLVDG
jgi:L-lactate dehydrogenase complex protein LldG